MLIFSVRGAGAIQARNRVAQIRIMSPRQRLGHVPCGNLRCQAHTIANMPEIDEIWEPPVLLARFCKSSVQKVEAPHRSPPSFLLTCAHETLRGAHIIIYAAQYEVLQLGAIPVVLSINNALDGMYTSHMPILMVESLDGFNKEMLGVTPRSRRRPVSRLPIRTRLSRTTRSYPSQQKSEICTRSTSSTVCASMIRFSFTQFMCPISELRRMLTRSAYPYPSEEEYPRLQKAMRRMWGGDQAGNPLTGEYWERFVRAKISREFNKTT